MRILHTSDWHLGHTFTTHDRTDEFEHFFRQLISIAKDRQPDAIVVSGDIFHTANPNIASQKLFFNTLDKLHRAVPDCIIVITAGNHDSGARIEASKAICLAHNIHIIGTYTGGDEATLSQFLVEVPGKGLILAVPFFPTSYFPAVDRDNTDTPRMQAFFLALQEYAETINSAALPVVMMAHVAVDGCDTHGHDEGIVAGMATESLTKFGNYYDYLALGHIHKPQDINKRVRYCGTPLAISFAEAYAHSVSLVEISQHGALPDIEKVEISPMRQIYTIHGNTREEAMETLEGVLDQDCYVRITLDPSVAVTPEVHSIFASMFDGKAARFCRVENVKVKAAEAAAVDDADAPDLETIQERNPIDVACEYYKKKNDAEMPLDLKNLLQDLISTLNL